MCFSKNLNMGITRVSGRPADTALSPLEDANLALALSCCTPSEIMDPCSLWLQWPVAHSCTLIPLGQAMGLCWG